MSDVQLVRGDCLEKMKGIPDKSIDMVLCDLPYGTTKLPWDCPINLECLWQEYDRVVKINGAVVLFAQSPFDKVLGLSNMSNLRYEWIWEKGEATGHLNAKKMPLKAHESLLVFYRKLPTYNPQKTQGHVRKSANKSFDTTTLYGSQPRINGVSYDSTERYPRSVIKFSKDKQKSSLHPTQKPVALCEYMIRTYTNEGETVLDNCMGSGTTGVACINTGRKFIGMELEEEYFNVAAERINDAIGI